MLVGHFNVEPTKIPCLAKKGFRLGSWLILRELGLWLLVCNLLPLASRTGVLLVVTEETL